VGNFKPMSFEEYTRTAPLDEIKSKLSLILKENSETQSTFGVQLLYRAQICEDQQEVKTILDFLCTHFEPHPKITITVKNINFKIVIVLVRFF
jgi:hypothetical protein